MQFWRTITPLGKGVICGALILALGGYFGSWIEFQAIALALAATLIFSLTMAIGHHPFDVALRLHKDRIVVGERAMILVSITNSGRSRSRSASVELPVQAQVHRFTIPRLKPGETHEELLSLQTTQRAVLTIGPVLTVRADPVGLFARRVSWGDSRQLIVHPLSRLLPANLLGSAQDLDGSQGEDPSDADLNFHTLREYELGDDRRAIHWKSSAKIGTLLVRQYTMSQRTNLLIHIDCVWEHYAEDAEREEAISVAASLAVSTLTSGGQVQLGWQGRMLPARSPMQALDSLAQLEFQVPQEASTTPGHAPRLRLLRLEAQGIAVLLTGSKVEFGDVATLSRSLPASLPAVGLKVGMVNKVRPSTVRRLRIIDGANLQTLPQVFGELLS